MIFGDFPSEFSNLKNSKVVLIPVPYDGTSTWIKGAEKGPRALLDASVNLENYDIETGTEAYKQGIFTDSPVEEKSSPDAMVDAVKKRVADHLDEGRMVIVIGGEHSVSIGAIKAYSERYKDLTILQLDAHTDLRDEYHGEKNNHACVMKRAKESCPIVQVGIRSMDSSELSETGSIFYAKEIHEDDSWIDKAISKLNENVYITIDLDVFDPGVMPSTGTPEPGGLDWYQVTGFLRKVFKQKNVVGFDVVELCPNIHNKAPDFMAAKLIYKLLSYKGDPR